MSRPISGVAAASAALVLSSQALAQEALLVAVRSDQREYVLREPIQLTVTITNSSSSRVRIPQIVRFGQAEMEFIYFEVTNSLGVVRRVKGVRLHAQKFINHEYDGAPLAPGDSIQFFHYPMLNNVSVDESGAPSGNVEGFTTFPDPGTYNLRVVFHTRPEYTHLYGADGGPRQWKSNQIEIAVRRPDQVEAEILEALWHSDPEGEGGAGVIRRDLADLALVIQRYPTHPLTPHARYALGRLLYAQSIAERPKAAKDAVGILSELMESSSQFRKEQAAMFLALSYRRSGDVETGVQIMSRLMDEHPNLWTSWRFVWSAALLTPEPEQALRSWRLREVQEGAKPVRMDAISGAWSDL